MVAWCDANGVDLKSSESLRTVQHPKLRSIMLLTSRSLTDGRRVRLSDVLLYEKTIGEPMPGFALGLETAEAVTAAARRADGHGRARRLVKPLGAKGTRQVLSGDRTPTSESAAQAGCRFLG